MKTLRLVGMAIIAVLMCVNLTSCSDDDDEDEGVSYAKMILGSWETGTGNYCEIWTFKSNGTGSIEFVTNDYEPESFTWKISGETITFKSENADGSYDIWDETIKTLTDTELVLEYYEGSECWTTTYRKN